MTKRLICCSLVFLAYCCAAEKKLSVLIVDGVNNHDWAAGTRGIKTILEGSGRFTVDVCTLPQQRPDFKRYDVVVNNYNGGHTATGQRWPREVEQALETYVRDGGGLVIFHAANNAFLNWPEYNEMIGLGWRDKSFGPGLAVGLNGEVVTIPKGSGLGPGHGPRHDFEVFTLAKEHPITAGLPAHWMHRSEQLTHGQHGPAQGLTILTYAFSEISRQGEPMDWVRQYGRGRVYTTMLGHTWKNRAEPQFRGCKFSGAAGARHRMGCHWQSDVVCGSWLEAADERQEPGRLGSSRRVYLDGDAGRCPYGPACASEPGESLP